jgi:uncharacterized membrane protein
MMSLTNTRSMGVIVFCVGALGYPCVEFIFRGHTHWSMALTGGACLLSLYYYATNNKKAPIFLKGIIGALIFTVFEFCVGLLVNIYYGWHIWDYSGEPGNLLGQICPKYTLIWFGLSLVILTISSTLCSLYRACLGGIQD